MSGFGIGMFAGIRVSVSPYATSTAYELRANPIKKRRKGWSVAKLVKPAAFRLADGSMVVHPAIHAELMKHTEATP